jgi:hypothetical protein
MPGVTTSVQSCGTGKDQYLLIERFGIASFALALVVERGQLLSSLRSNRTEVSRRSHSHSIVPGGFDVTS